jgi:hypothetical protein
MLSSYLISLVWTTNKMIALIVVLVVLVAGIVFWMRSRTA